MRDEAPICDSRASPVNLTDYRREIRRIEREAPRCRVDDMIDGLLQRLAEDYTDPR